MGSNISVEGCEAHYGIRIDCTPPERGNVGGEYFEYNPDIAGLGVLGAFLAVTILSLILGIFTTSWYWWKSVLFPKPKPEENEEHGLKRTPKDDVLNASGVVEVLMVSFSDQQIFTGAAYAITLRYVKGCTVSAYHYNIVGNMLLITCATHLMAVTVSRNYWEHRYMGLLRILITAMLYLATGLLLSNQDAGSFPTAIPPAGETGFDEILTKAACFHEGSDTWLDPSSLISSHIPGWNQFVAMVLFYIIAVLIRLGRFIRGDPGGKRRERWNKRVPRSLNTPLGKKVSHIVYGAYLIIGLGISAWTVVTSGLYIWGLLQWVDRNEWVKDPDGKDASNPEMDPNSFGQLIPLFLISLSIFTFIQVLAENADKKKQIRDQQAAASADTGADVSESGKAVEEVKSEKETKVKEKTQPVSPVEV